MKINFTFAFAPFFLFLFFFFAKNTHAQILLSTEASYPSCYSCNGEVNIWNIYGSGTPPYTFLWSNGATTQNVSNLCAGNYCVTVTDAVGLTKVECFLLPDVQMPLYPILCVTDPTCFGYSDGSVKLTIAGGTPPYSYYWSGPGGFISSVQNLNNLPAGPYTVIVTDISGCTGIATATLNNPPLMNISSSVTNSGSSGNQGAIDLSVSGGVAPYNYLWSNGSNTQDLYALPPGTYVVTVVDANGCSQMHSGSVQYGGGGDSLLMVTGLVTNSGCGGQCSGAINLSVSGGSGYFFAWSTGSNEQNIDYLCPGTYCVTVYDNAGNAVPQCYTVGQGQSQFLDIQSTNAAFCNYDSTGSSPVCEKVCPHSAITYFVEPPINCGQPISLQSATWTVSGAESYSISSDKTEVKVLWGNSGAGLVKLEADNAQQNLCFQSSQCVTIVEEPESKFISDPPAPPNAALQVCKGQTVKFQNQSLAYDVLEWQFSDDLSVLNEENPQHTFLSPGTFTVMLIARSNCLCADTSTLIVEVLDTEPPLLECVGSVCPGESVTYTTASNCSAYDWVVSPNGTVQSGGQESDNSVTVQWNSGSQGSIALSASGCGGAACPQASVFYIPIISDEAEIRGPEVVCCGSEEEYSIEAFDGTDFVWSLLTGGNIVAGQGTNKVVVIWSAQANPGATHLLSVKYNNCYLGCGGEDDIPVKILSPFVIDGPVEICQSATVTFTTKFTAYSGSIACNWNITAPDGTIVWTSPGATTSINFTPANGAGTYRIFAVPSNTNSTCSDGAEWRVKVATNPPKPVGIAGPTLICPSTPYTYTLSVNSPYSLEWKIKNGAPAPTTQLGENVNVTWGNTNPRWLSVAQISTDGLGCVSDTIQMNIQSLPSATITGTPQLCVGAVGSYSAISFQNIDYQWEIIPANAGTIKSGQGKNVAEIFWQTPGNHTVRLTRCGSQANFPVTVHAEPEPISAYPVGLCPNEVGTALAAAIYTNYLWKNEAGNTISNSTSAQVTPGTYTLVVTDVNGCKSTTEFTVNKFPEPNITVTTADPTGFCANSRYVSLTALTPDDGDFDYEWYRDGVPLGVNAPTYATNQYGYYSASATNEYGCTASDGTVHIFEYCGGVCHNPSHGPKCDPGDLTFKYAPSPRCDSFQFNLINFSGMYQPGSAVWHFGESGSDYLGSSTDENPNFVFPNAGKYIVVLYAQLTNGAKCIVLDSVDVEAVAQFSQVLGCPGDSTFFTDESTRLPEASFASWQWNFGETGAPASNFPSPGHPYASAGNYTATLTVTTASGCTSSYSENVFVPTPPSPNFAPPAANCVNNATEFKALISSDVTSVEWDFGHPASSNLNTSDAELAYHKYSPAGNYNVSLTALTATNVYGCSATFSQPVAITPNPFSGNITPTGNSVICEGKTITLSAPAASSATYLWSTGAATPNITVGDEGVYDVTLTNANGCTYSPAAKTVEVNPAPVGVIKALEINDLGQVTGVSYPSLAVCAGEDVNLQVFDNGNFISLWSGGNGFGETITFSEDRGNALTVGTHIFTVTITNPSTGCTTVAPPFDVTVNPLPSGFSLATNNVCAGTPSTITYTGPQPPDWQILWNTGDSGPNPLTIEEAGLYFVRVVNEHGCVAQSNTVVIFPGPNIAALPSGCHARCNPDTLCLPSLPDIVSWQWYFEGAPIPGATSSNLVATQSGTYWADLTDLNGCNAQSAPLTLDLYQGSGNILGQVWADVNDNGVIDAADTLVSGVPVLLFQNNTQVAASQSAANGGFDFLNILSTGYVVQIDGANLDPFWEIVIGDGPVTLAGCAAQGYADLLVVKKQCSPLASSVQLTACPGNSATYNGVSLSIGSSQDFVFQNALGCDSVVTVTVSALQTSASSLSVKTCPGTTYSYAGVDLAVGQTQNFTFQNYLGCDSVVTVSVSALQTSASSLSVKTCPGTTYSYAGVDLAVGQTQDFTFQNYLGCDSVVTVSVAALQTSASSLSVKTCPGTTYSYAGVDLAVGQTQDFTFQNYLGCDSVVTVSVVALQTSASSLSVKTCPGTTYSYAGVDLAVGQTQDFTFQNYLGCDSVVTVSVAALQTSSSAASFGVCPNETYEYAGVQLPAGAVQDFIFKNYLGCDSVVTVTIFEKNSSSELLEVKICPNEIYTFNGTDIAPGETREFHFLGFEGCDSTVTVTVTAWPSLNFEVESEISCPTSPTGSLAVTVISGASLPTGFSLNNIDFQTNTLFENLAAGDYTVFVQDNNGCVFEQTVTVAASPRLEMSLPGTLVIPCEHAEVTLAPEISGDLTGLQLLWWNGAKTPSVTVTEAGPVWLEATNHCETLRSEASVVWEDLAENQVFVYVPNVFAPEADLESNRTFQTFFASNIELLEYRMEVYDRWGNFMFWSETPDVGWEGSFDQKMMDPGVYVWHLRAKIAFCGRVMTLERQGDVTVVR
jgi:PKD repeat protein